jgi:hypothetical protein
VGLIASVGRYTSRACAQSQQDENDVPVADCAVAYPPCAHRLGIPVPDALVLELARLLRKAEFVDTAETLERAYDAERRIVALTIADRESILRALEDCPDGLGELHATLLKEHEWRVREGLV